MTYRLFRLAAGSYDVLLNGEVVASLVRGLSERTTWTAELLEEVHMPAPFTAPEHEFQSFEAACQWLGNPEVRDEREQRWTKG